MLKKSLKEIGITTMNINNSSKTKCTGCGLCGAICPFDAIHVRRDHYGFINPEIDEMKCIRCGLCVKHCTKFKGEPCSVLNTNDVFAMWSNNPMIRRKSSSGGIGYEISLFGYRSGYDVWGVIYDSEKKMSRHIKAKNEKDLLLFQSSKYLQSDTSELMSAVVNHKSDKPKMIFGTPCQIRVIKEYISDKNINDILLIDVFCRGVPTYLLWDLYLNEMSRKQKISVNCNVNFRDKKNDWHDYQMTLNDSKRIYTSSSSTDMFYKLYTSALCFRDSCYDCDLKLNNSYADIRIGDFWGERFQSRKDGVSLVIINSEKGQSIFETLNNTSTVVESASFNEVIKAQKYIYNKKDKKVYSMRTMLIEAKSLDLIYKKLVQLPIYKIIIIKIYQIIPRNIQLKIKKMFSGIKNYD